MVETSSRVFITHSSRDRKLAERLVEALHGGTDVARERIFCSSIEGYGVTVGRDFMQYIQRQLQNTHLVVPLITPAYLDSVFCQWELGAAWVTEVEMFPIRVDPVTHSDLPGPLQQVHVAELTKAGLSDLAERIAASVGINVVGKIWEPRRNKLLKDLPGILKGLGTEWQKTPQAKLRRAQLWAEQSKSLHRVFHFLRDAAAPKLQIDGDGNLERFRKIDFEQFQEKLDRAVDEIAALFSGSTGHPCRATIKGVFIDEEEVPYAWDLARSGEGNLLPAEPIEGNTDFESLMLGTQPYFLCNDIDKLRRAGRYANSHIVAGKPLNYNSTVVWPVRLKLRQRPKATKKLDAQNWQDLIAYLCVDAPAANVFDDLDVWVGAAIADGMYMVLRPWTDPDESDSTVAGE